MSTQFHTKSKQGGAPSNSAHNLITASQKKVNKVGNVCYDGNSALMKPSLRTQVAIQCQTSYSGLLNSSGSADFLVRRGCLAGLSESCHLRFRVTNNHASAVTLAPAPLLVRVEFLTNGSSHIAQTLYPEELFFDNNFFETPEKLAVRSVQMNSSSSLGAGASIASGASADYSVPLLGSLFERELYIPRVNDLTVRVHFVNQSPESGTLDCALSNFDLVLVGREVADAEKGELEAIYDRKHHFRLYQTIQHPISSTLAASTAYQWALSGVHGLCNSFFLYDRSLPLTTTSPRTIRDYIENFQILNSQGNNILQTVETSDNNRYMTQPSLLPSTLSVNHGVLFWSFSESPLIDQKTSSITGYYPFSGAESLHITTNSSATGSNQIQLNLRMAMIATVEPNGNIYVAK
jgi:hypothetical protein